MNIIIALEVLDSDSARTGGSPVTEEEELLLSYGGKFSTWMSEINRPSADLSGAPDEFCKILNGLVKAIRDYMVDP
jgi:hypothetical protein